ncbi:MAG: indole-3-glycerol phosphate synthase TrpC [Spirochaetales bacterium]|nr:indole-3-glycerol phosphate synthase TrpC [Spirochaetales bacterium]
MKTPRILDEIAASTRLRVAAAKERLEPRILYRQAREKAALQAAASGFGSGFAAALRKPGLSFICEVKRASPSKGIIAAGDNFPFLDIARAYEEAGADAVSVLTEPKYFLGEDRYLAEIAAAVKLPLLRKDFIIDPYQIYEAKVLGAQAVLLICALLDPPALSAFLSLASELGLAALTEVHNGEELDMALAAEPQAGIIGINNRNLQTFEVDLDITGRLAPRIPEDRLVVSESGVASADDVRRLASYGVDALLVGEHLMRADGRKALLAELKAAGGA